MVCGMGFRKREDREPAFSIWRLSDDRHHSKVSHLADADDIRSARAVYDRLAAEHPEDVVGLLNGGRIVDRSR
jgi:hypothetical protein